MAGNRKEYYERAEKYLAEYIKADRDLIDKKRQAKVDGNIYVEAQPKVALVIRIKGFVLVIHCLILLSIHHHAPKVRKILQLLRLRQIHNGTFVKLNKATLNMLQLIGYTIAWGYPNRNTIRHLLYKRGFGKINGQRIPITSNEVIES